VIELVVGGLAVVVVVLLVASVLVVRRDQAVVVTRFGRVRAIARSGLVLRVPFLDRVTARIDLREQIMTFPATTMPAADGRTVAVSGTVTFAVTDAAAYAGRRDRFPATLERSTMDRLRDQLRVLSAEQSRQRHRAVGDTVRAELVAELARWGVTVNAVTVTVDTH
jgi:regulator of protease activity HflC (stomatin/prohibitin superfamily)